MEYEEEYLLLAVDKHVAKLTAMSNNPSHTLKGIMLEHDALMTELEENEDFGGLYE
jgi:hypothetical protein